MRKKETNWFAHDCNDQHDLAMSAMRLKYKMEGVGSWWTLMEILRMEEDYRYDIARSFGYEVLAMRLMTTEAKVKQFINDLINYYGMLQTDGVYIWSDKLLKRMEYMEDKKEKLRKAGSMGGKATRDRRLADEGDNDIDNQYNSEVPNQQNSSNATPLPQQFAAHNNTLHNNTEHNNTEQNTTTTEHNKKAFSGNTIAAVDDLPYWEEEKEYYYAPCEAPFILQTIKPFLATVSRYWHQLKPPLPTYPSLPAPYLADSS